MDISTDIPNIPPIVPFILGSGQSPRSPFRRKTPPYTAPLDMTSLQTAANNAISLNDIPTIPTTTNDDESSASLTSMDTADVSTAIKLLPKSLLNPYSKKGKNKQQPESSTLHQTTRRTTNKEVLPSSPPSTNTLTEYDASTLPVTKGTPLGKGDRLKPKTIEQPQVIDLTRKEAEFQELTQEELRIIYQAILTQEQEWIEVESKSQKVPTTPLINPSPQINTNRYSVLQDDDENMEENSDSTTVVVSTVLTPTKSPKTKPRITNSRMTTPGRGDQGNTKSQQRLAPMGRGGGIPSPTNTPLSKPTQLKSPPNQQPVMTITSSLSNEHQPMDIENSSQNTQTTSSTNQAPTTPNQVPTTPTTKSNYDQGETTPSRTPTPRRTNNKILKYTYQIMIKAFPNEKEKQTFTKLNVLDIVLKAFQASDQETSIIIPQDESQQQRMYTKINPASKNKNEYAKIENLLHTNSTGTIQGNILLTSNKKYSTIKKHQDTKTILQDKYNIYTNKNDINSKNLLEVGFFVRHLVRHETAECSRWLLDEVPSDTPPFQQEIVTVWAGPLNQRRGTEVLKIYSDKKMSKNYLTSFERHSGTRINHTS
jgi:hypothetical protein